MQFDIIGKSKHITRLKKEIATIAPTELPVLIEGETGTGKELVARGLHKASLRKEKPFVAVNCALLGNIAESELFGQVKGAFTGAVKETIGYVGAAKNGTIFLDEIETLPLEVQAKLLRFLDYFEYTKVGDHKTQIANIRIIAATNISIEKMIAKSEFREDLFYRLAGTIIHTVPLRYRPEDIPELSKYILKQFEPITHIKSELADSAIKALQNFDWKGNVRQLRQVLRKSQISYGENINGKQIKETLANFAISIKKKDEPTEKLVSYKEAKKIALTKFETKYFKEVKRQTGGKLKEILRVTKMHEKNYYQKIKPLDLIIND